MLWAFEDHRVAHQQAKLGPEQIAALTDQRIPIARPFQPAVAMEAAKDMLLAWAATPNA